MPKTTKLPPQSDLWDNSRKDKAPLAERLRPLALNAVVGQDHLLGPDAPLAKMLSSGKLSSIILWGPPGCGKTTIARLLAQEVKLHFEPLSAVFSGVADLRKAFDSAKQRKYQGTGTLLFIDEIHRFNRAQQDGFLPYVEDGTISLVGATTENPSFELNSALLSRMRVLELKRLDEKALENILKRAEGLLRKPLPLTPEARETLKNMADGDGRYILNLAEALFSYPNQPLLTPEKLPAILQKRAPLYDKKQDGHYNLISALHKSLRGSDTNAALYWFYRMIEGGEDPHFIARRLTRFAVEDVGLADPNALTQAIAAWQAYERLGSPEGELALVQLVIYLGTAPKSNAAYMASKAGKKLAAATGSLPPPKHILNAPTQMMKELDYSKGYAYDHDTPEAFSGQNYFPEEIGEKELYYPNERGFEREIRKRLDYWNNLRKAKRAK